MEKEAVLWTIISISLISLFLFVFPLNIETLTKLTGNVASETTALKIMPIGDSITHCMSYNECYRYWLSKKLKDNGYSNFDFVGNMNGVWPNNNPVNVPDWSDQQHEGHGGWTADQILNGVANEPTTGNIYQWVTKYNPDIALIHIGINDLHLLWSGSKPSSSKRDSEILKTANEIFTIVEVLRQNNPNIKILLARITPSPLVVPEEDVVKLNEWISYLASAYNSENSPIIVVDLYSGYNPSLDSVDGGVHPNQNGAQKSADKWYTSLIPLLASIPDGYNCVSSDWLGKQSSIGLWRISNQQYNPDARFLCHTDNVFYRCTKDADETAANAAYWNIFSIRINDGAPTPNYICNKSQGKWVSVCNNNGVCDSSKENPKNCPNDCPATITQNQIFCSKGEWIGKNSTIGLWLSQTFVENPDARFLCHTDNVFYRCTKDADETAANAAYWNIFSIRINDGAPTPNYICNKSQGKWVSVCNNNGVCDSSKENPKNCPNDCQCSIDSECGASGFTGGLFCSGKNLVRNYTSYNCSGSCKTSITQIINKTCGAYCFAGECVNSTCSNDSECNDNNPLTLDVCLNNSTVTSSCIYSPMNDSKRNTLAFTDLNLTISSSGVTARHEGKELIFFQNLNNISFLKNLTVVISNSSDKTSFIFIMNPFVNMSYTKKVYLERKNLSSNAVCFIDREVRLDSDLSNCTKLKCPGVSSEYSCDLSNGIFVISGLRNSFVKEDRVYCGDGICYEESCSNCPIDCGNCSEPIIQNFSDFASPEFDETTINNEADSQSANLNPEQSGNESFPRFIIYLLIGIIILTILIFFFLGKQTRKRRKINRIIEDGNQAFTNNNVNLAKERYLTAKRIFDSLTNKDDATLKNLFSLYNKINKT